jgi:hypothetical protein
MANLLLGIDKFVTVHNKCSKIPPSISVHFATCVRKSRVVGWSWRFFMRAAASEMRGSKSSLVSTFRLYTSLFIQRHKQKCNGVRPGDLGNHITVTIIRCMFIWTFLSEWLILLHPKYEPFLLKHPVCTNIWDEPGTSVYKVEDNHCNIRSI